eukprot:CAMPEP_0114510370 /NCGR_PEP_ID=MMETSP0109-20121206/13746_1 /TAXON_ID=29199 /ORGANISM="Chlorarachnion reptans, Strain CCCM449" /LENGTH=79 /DNA_ID=CAMNT_0001689663 /DNA_START=332 /DNA_END=568 /DNA_ORIENTATION=+
MAKGSRSKSLQGSPRPLALFLIQLQLRRTALPGSLTAVISASSWPGWPPGVRQQSGQSLRSVAPIGTGPRAGARGPSSS